MILTGYAVILAYIFSLIFLLGPVIQKISDTETSRKVIHCLLFAVWIFLDRFFAHTIHQILIALIFLVLNALSYKFKIYKSVEREEDNHLGTVYFAVAISVIMTVAYFFPEYYVCSGISVFCLTFGDGMAALVGKRMPKIVLREGKTLAGFCACAVFSALALLLFERLYRPGLSMLSVLALALIAAIMELVGKGLDNFSIVGATFVLSRYLLASGSSALAHSVLIAEAIFLIVFMTRAIDYPGSLLSMVIVTAFSLWGGPAALLVLLLSYFIIFFVALYKKKVVRYSEKEKSRGAKQILVNGLFGFLFVLLYRIEGETGFLLVALTAIGGCFVDSLSSDVGILSKGEPYDIFRRKYVQKGLSGGMSVLGTIAALIGSLVVALATCSLLELPFTTFFALGSVIFLQTVVDSFLGSLFQGKYRCPDCGTVLEKSRHCSRECILISGYRWMDNNMVNLVSSTLITALAAVVFLR